MNDLASIGFHFRELDQFVAAVRMRMQRGSLLWRALATGLTGPLRLPKSSHFASQWYACTTECYPGSHAATQGG